eukprot:GHRQ01037536.1.p2 GENE.GHRQ01037536.1~~GHRQ01037536.1.p2  ORF type:complete len:178 (+),score=84.69 GHRQ01037536.1:282-815(+)
MAAVQQQPEQEQQDGAAWGACSSAVLGQHQLQGLLEGWGKALLLLQGRLQQGADPATVQQEQLLQLQEEWLAAISRHCGTGNTSPCAGSVVDAVLQCMLQQHVGRLETTVEAFRAADQRRRGALGINQFRIFCQHLNDAMSDEEVMLLWQELDKQHTGSVTFSGICACLLPVMSDGA